MSPGLSTVRETVRTGDPGRNCGESSKQNENWTV